MERDKFPGPTRWLMKARYRIRASMLASPNVYLPLMRLRPSRRDKVVGHSTDIVIEGFPRSGNTFAVVAFTLVQNVPVRVAHHLHAPAQVLWSVRHSIPTLVLIRDPVEAVLSLVIRHPHLNLRDGFSAYCDFYLPLLQVRNKVVVGPFDKVTRSFGEIVEQINHKFGCQFVPFDHSPENMDRCFALIEEKDRIDRGHWEVGETTVSRPSRDRDKLKARLKMFLDEPEVQRYAHEAQKVYAQFRT